MKFFNREPKQQITFQDDYQTRLLKGITEAEKEIGLLQEDADVLAEQIQRDIAERQKTVDQRSALIDFVTKQRKALGLPVVDYDLTETEAPEEETE